MIGINRRVAGIAALILLAASVSACGDSEGDQRKTFIGFLQTRILDKQGVRVPKPNAEESKSFGPYAEHYALIVDFNGQIDKAVQGPYKIAQTNAPRSIQELLDRRQDVKAMAETMSGMLGEMRKTLAETEAKRAALKQPDDLKAVYGAAYERSVNAPAQAFLAVVPVAVEGLQASVQLADYLDTHRTTVKISGSSIQATDNKTRAEVTRLLNAMNAQSQKLSEARRHLQKVFEGK